MRFLIVLLLMCLCLINAQNLNPCFGVTDDVSVFDCKSNNSLLSYFILQTFFPHPRTLTKFLACFDGILVEGSCPPGMDFNRIELFCDLSQNPTTTRRPNDGNICAGVPDEVIIQ